jgi:hypothetical protein
MVVDRSTFSWVSSGVTEDTLGGSGFSATEPPSAVEVPIAPKNENAMHQAINIWIIMEGSLLIFNPNSDFRF